MSEQPAYRRKLRRQEITVIKGRLVTVVRKPKVEPPASREQYATSDLDAKS